MNTTGPNSTSNGNNQPPKDVNKAVKLLQNLTKLLNKPESYKKMPEYCYRIFDAGARIVDKILNNNNAFRPETLLVTFSDFVSAFLKTGRLYRRMEKKDFSNLNYRFEVFNGSRDNPEAAIKDTVEISLDNLTNRDNCKPNCIVKVFLVKIKKMSLNITVGGKEYLLGSSIILVEMVVNGRRVTELGTQHAIINIPLATKREIRHDMNCAYLDAESNSTTKEWSVKGVQFHSFDTNKMIAKCKTNHISNFVVVFAVEEPLPKDVNKAVKSIRHLTKLLNNTESCNKMPEYCNRIIDDGARIVNNVLNNNVSRPETLLVTFSDFVLAFLKTEGFYRPMKKDFSNLNYRFDVFNGSRDNPEAAIKDTVEISLDNITNRDNCKPNCIMKVFLGEMRMSLNITLGSKEYLLGSSIILVEIVVNGRRVTDLGTEYAIVKIPLVAQGEIRPDMKCTYLDAESNSATKEWSVKGVQFHAFDTNKTIAKCQTNHMSNFAVLFAVEEPTSDEDKFALDLISYIGCGLTLLAVVITLVIYLIFRKDAPIFSVDRNIVHVHLMVSLALVQIVFLVTLGVTTSPVGCKIVAVLLHYLLMASFCWMLLEGILLYLKIVMGFEGENVDLKKFYIFGWVFPAVIIAILLAVAVPLDKMDDVYGNGCFLSPTKKMIWILLTPSAICVVFNLFVIVAVLRVLLTLSDDDTRKAKAKTGLRGLVILSPLLGFTWAFALVVHKHNTAIFWQYAFCLSNSFQGFFIFFIHGIGNSEIQEAIKRRVYPPAILAVPATQQHSSNNHSASCETPEVVETAF